MKSSFFRPLSMLLLTLSLPIAAHANDAAADAQAVADITALVNDFLEHVDQAATHDRFWASDLVYTSSAGTVTDKAEIMKGFEEAPEPEPAPAAEATPATAPDAPPAEPERYTAEDILVRPFGDTAALTFRLVHHGADGKRSFYRNSGMFVRRDGRWQVVTWQATKVPEPEAK
jgi:hypothetical protein